LQAQAVLAMAESSAKLDQPGSESIFVNLRSITGGNEQATEGIDRLEQIVTGAIAAGVSPSHLQLDVSIARGLDYYTGVIVETFLDDLPSIGSVCSGGRYDNLAGMFTKQHLPGIGASLGLDRLLAAMQQLNLLPTAATPAPVLIAFFDAERRNDYLRLATELRRRGVACEVYPDPKKLGHQLRYGDEKGFEVALIAGKTEWETGRVQIKDLKRKIAIDCSYTHAAPGELVDAIRRVLLEGVQPSLA
jgi:histidyl-tRNA synthetase